MTHITVRRATPDDAGAIQRIYDTPRAVWGTLQVPYASAEQRRKRLAELGDNAHPLVAVAEGEVIGQLTLFTNTRPRRKHTGDLGMAVRDDWQGRGAGTALMMACVDLADHWLNIHRLELTVFVDNEPAIRLYKKFGFVTEGRLVDYGYRDGRYVDTYIMGRIRSKRTEESTDFAV